MDQFRIPVSSFQFFGFVHKKIDSIVCHIRFYASLISKDFHFMEPNKITLFTLKANSCFE